MDKNRRPQEPVLIVEDKEENQALLVALLKSIRVPCKVAQNGKEALDLVNKEKFSLYIVDLMMPVMSGEEFIRNLKEVDPQPVIIVQTALDSTDTIINIMKLGVYDYIIKPIDSEVFTRVVTKALEYKYLKNIEDYIQKVEIQKLRGQIEWLSYKESLRRVGSDSSERSSIYNLKTSLSQGSGFGSMTTIIDMLKSNAKELEDGRISVDKGLFELLLENNQITKSMLKALANLSDLLEKKFNLTLTPCKKLIEKIPEFTKSLEPYLPQKRMKINYPQSKLSGMVRVDLENFGLVIEELCINAYKYSEEGSVIDIFSHINNGYLVITVKSNFRKDSYGGIPEDKEKLVTLPFYRIHPPDESVHSIEKFGLGLGLTMVEHILSKHNGLFFIHNAKDHTTSDISLCVLAEVFLPIENEEKNEDSL